MEYPTNFPFYFKDPSTKRAWISENKPIAPTDCENCGGLGMLSMFVATDGPFDTPPNPYLGPPEEPLVSHWAEGRWWLGHALTGVCPTCHGVKAASDGVAGAAPDRVLAPAEVALAKKLASHAKDAEEIRYDWQTYDDL